MLEYDLIDMHEKSAWSLEGASDDALVLIAQSGDHGAFLELRKRHAKNLLPRIYRITRSWDDAEDVLQESFLKAFVHLATFERRSSFSSWLTRIAINSAFMMLRKRRAIEISIDGMGGDEEMGTRWDPPDSRRNPEEIYARQEIERQLLRAIDRLSPQLRRAVQMRQAQDYSTKEVASATGNLRIRSEVAAHAGQREDSRVHASFTISKAHSSSLVSGRCAARREVE